MTWDKLLALVAASEAQGAVLAAQGQPGAFTAGQAALLRAQLLRLRDLGEEPLYAVRLLHAVLNWTQVEMSEPQPALQAVNSVLTQATAAGELADDLDVEA